MLSIVIPTYNRNEKVLRLLKKIESINTEYKLSVVVIDNNSEVSTEDNNKFLPWLMHEMIDKTDDINLTSGIQKRDFIFISDVVAAYDLVLQKRMSLPNWSQFDIGTNIFTEVKEFVLLLAKELEKLNNTKIVAKLKFGLIQYRKGDIMVPELDNVKLIELGWKPKVDVESGIISILNKYRS